MCKKVAQLTLLHPSLSEPPPSRPERNTVAREAEHNSGKLGTEALLLLLAKPDKRTRHVLLLVSKGTCGSEAASSASLGEHLSQGGV
ncbi:hypothetical protein AMEX_G6339 [Astyanax mexicanus]|uniref:Uncharacterized protein n=1 Tax=Astyanax mexicanus TaxID=7994 RepID=A0A8T2M2D2_ASTMX|nr:hypothetical protein AMEX_G6339 [Astyanax mexicanus]